MGIFLHRHQHLVCIVVSILLLFSSSKSSALLAKGAAKLIKWGLESFQAALSDFFIAFWAEMGQPDTYDQTKILAEIRSALSEKSGDGGPIHVHMNQPASTQLGPLAALIDKICTVTIGFVIAIAFRQYQQPP